MSGREDHGAQILAVAVVAVDSGPQPPGGGGGRGPGRGDETGPGPLRQDRGLSGPLSAGVPPYGAAADRQRRGLGLFSEAFPHALEVRIARGTEEGSSLRRPPGVDVHAPGPPGHDLQTGPGAAL